jgi:hypothetical protein
MSKPSRRNKNNGSLQTRIACVRHDPDLVRCDTSDRGDEADQGSFDGDPQEESMSSGWRRPAHDSRLRSVTDQEVSIAHEKTGHPEGLKVDVPHKMMYRTLDSKGAAGPSMHWCVAVRQVGVTHTQANGDQSAASGRPGNGKQA